MPDHELPPSGDASIVISCTDCPMRRTSACHDCVVTYLCADGETPIGAGPVSLDRDELQMVQRFRKARMVPSVRHPRHLDVVR